MLRNSWLFALFALFALSSAFNLDGVEEYIHHGVKRQASGTGNNNAPTSAPPESSAAPPASSAAPPPSQTPQPSATPDPTTEPTSAAPPPSAAPSQGPASSTTRGQSQRPTTAPQSSFVDPDPSRTTPITIKTPLVTFSPRPFTTVSRTTLPNGVVAESTVSGVESVAVTTGEAEATIVPSTQKNTDSSDGLSDSNKKVIGGVVGGIGGALLLGGIALVFWRMRKRQNKVTADDDDLNLNTGAALGDKPQNGTGASPFQSNLEQYHNPGGRPNAAANF